ncbi:MAG: ferric reductase-like transmembrane domain-containing protein [Anaerolineaceae bacterium]
MKKKPAKIQLLTFLIAIIPAVWFLINYTQGAYNPYPTLFLTQFSGKYAIAFLLLSLACTPFYNIFNMNALYQARRSFGLASFYYAAIHASTFIILDYQLNLDWLIPEFIHKPYLILGLAAFLLLILLAFTSGKKFQKKFSKLWIQIHRLVYIIGLLVLIHIYFAMKGDKRFAFVYLMLYVVLMLLRLPVVKGKFSIKECPICQKLNHWLIS